MKFMPTIRPRYLNLVVVALPPTCLGVLGPRSNVGLHPDEVTIAEVLKTKGCATMCIGKWHVEDSGRAAA